MIISQKKRILGYNYGKMAIEGKRVVIELN